MQSSCLYSVRSRYYSAPSCLMYTDDSTVKHHQRMTKKKELWGSVINIRFEKSGSWVIRLKWPVAIVVCRVTYRECRADNTEWQLQEELVRKLEDRVSVILAERDMLRGNHIPLTNLTAPSLDHLPQFLAMAMLVGGFWEIKPIKLKYSRWSKLVVLNFFNAMTPNRL